MAIRLNDLRKTRSVLPPRVLIYGPPGLGKTSLGTEWPNPVLFDIEGGRPANVPIEKVPGFDADQIGSYDAVMEALGSLYTDDHDFQTLVFDTLDRFEPYIWQKTCEDNNWASIEAPGYGKGYVGADKYWRDFLEGLNALRRDRNMTIILIAHSDITRFDDPQAASYSRFDIRLHKRALAMVQDEVDAVLFVNQDTTIKQEDLGFNKKRARAEGGTTRLIYAEGRPAFVAKNRYGIPASMRYDIGQGYAALSQYLPGTVAPATEKEAA